MKLDSLSALFVGEGENDYRLIKNILSSLDIKDVDVLWAQDFDEGLDYAQNNEPDLILTDYHLGKHNGLDFLAEVRKRNCIKPVLLLSDKFDYQAEIESVRAGAEAYLEKSLDKPEQLKTGIVSAIERSQALMAIRRSESRMRGIFFWSSIGIVLFDMERLIVQSNPAFSKTIGFTDEELCAMDIADDFADPDNVETIRQEFSKVARNKRPYAKVQTRFQKRNGDWVWVDLTFSVFSETSIKPQFVIGLVEDVTEKKNEQFALEVSMKKMSYLSKDLISAQENERRDIVLELHDVVGGNLGAVKYLLEQIKLQPGKMDDSCTNLLSQMDKLVVDTLDEIERLSSSLRPPMLDDLGIFATLRWLVRQHNEIYTGINTTLKITIGEAAIPQSIEIVIFRIAQEALNNAAKHSQGNRIKMSLERVDRKFILKITDNGRGFDPEVLNRVDEDSGLGLRNMCKRAELTNGRLSIATAPDKGTTILAEWDSDKQKEMLSRRRDD